MKYMPYIYTIKKQQITGKFNTKEETNMNIMHSCTQNADSSYPNAGSQIAEWR